MNILKNGITKIESIARLQELKSGKLKNLTSNNLLFVDGSHNPLGAKVLNEYLQSLNCNKHIILGMMANKDHNEYMSYFKDIKSLTTIDIPINLMLLREMNLKRKLKILKILIIKIQLKKQLDQLIFKKMILF